MGYIIRKSKIIGDMKTLNAKPIWIGTSDKFPEMRRMMNTEQAELWVKESPDRKVIMKLKKFELE